MEQRERFEAADSDTLDSLKVRGRNRVHLSD